MWPLICKLLNQGESLNSENYISVVVSCNEKGRKKEKKAAIHK